MSGSALDDRGSGRRVLLGLVEPTQERLGGVQPLATSARVAWKTRSSRLSETPSATAYGCSPPSADSRSIRALRCARGRLAGEDQVGEAPSPKTSRSTGSGYGGSDSGAR